jgi:hypothetical protein
MAYIGVFMVAMRGAGFAGNGAVPLSQQGRFREMLPKTMVLDSPPFHFRRTATIGNWCPDAAQHSLNNRRISLC